MGCDTHHLSLGNTAFGRDSPDLDSPAIKSVEVVDRGSTGLAKPYNLRELLQDSMRFDCLINLHLRCLIRDQFFSQSCKDCCSPVVTTGRGRLFKVLRTAGDGISCYCSLFVYAYILTRGLERCFIIWRGALKSPFEPTHVVNGKTFLKNFSEWTQDENQRAQYDVQARNDVLKFTHEGIEEVKRARKNSLIQEYELFRMKYIKDLLHSQPPDGSRKKRRKAMKMELKRGQKGIKKGENPKPSKKLPEDNHRLSPGRRPFVAWVGKLAPKRHMSPDSRLGKLLETLERDLTWIGPCFCSDLILLDRAAIWDTLAIQGNLNQWWGSHSSINKNQYEQDGGLFPSPPQADITTRLEETLQLTIIQKSIPPKLKDPGSFTIPCTIGNISVGKALIDLGASINLMPLSMFEKIEGLELKPTRMTLQLADRSLKYPYGVVEDVLVKVDKFLFPVDFVIMELEEDVNVPLILGRPFMKTSRVLIDVENGKLKVRVQDEEVNFDVFQAMSHPKDNKGCFHLKTLDKLCMIQKKEVCDIPSLEETFDDNYEEVTGEDNKKKIKGRKPELKMLPPHLKYVFLEEEGNKPVIISNSLSPSEEEKLIEVLKANKGAIGWSISDLKSISPTYCMHKIFMEDNYKPVAQPQRRLYPTMKEEVRKEVLKLLEAGIIYPISDSSWVSPVQVIPKKGGMTVVYNEKNEFIPTRTVTGWRMCIDYRKLNNATRKDHFPLPFMDQMLERLASQDFYYFLDGYSGYNQIVAIFAYLMEKCIEVFVDDFSEKCHFMDTEGIVLGHKISSKGIEVDRAKVEVIEKLPPPTNVKGIRSFLGHAGFYRRFMKDFSKIEKPMSNLLVKDVPFVMNKECLKAFEILKERLISAPIIVAPDWNQNFVLICDASNYAIGAILGQRKKKEFDVEIRDKKGSENVIADHLSRLVNDEVTCKETDIWESFSYETLTYIQQRSWFADMANFKAAGVIPEDLTWQQRKFFLHDAKQFEWDDPYLFKIKADNLLRCCVTKEEVERILWHCHDSPYGGYFSGERTAAKVLQSGFYWPTLFKDAHNHAMNCDKCQRTGTISRRHEMPLQGILEVEIFYCWGIDFMGPFPPSFKNEYILVAIDYVSKSVEALACPKSDANTVIKFLKRQIFSRFGTPRVLISDGGSHFCNHQLAKVLKHYGVKHKVRKYRQAEVSNREIKRILEKTVTTSRKDWYQRLDDALRAYRTAMKTSIGLSPFQMVYGKACHLPVEMEHRALWALKFLNFDPGDTAEKRRRQIVELEEMRLHAYESSKNYKEKVTYYHDKKLLKRVFIPGQQVLLFNSQLKLFQGKLKSRWSGPFLVKEVLSHGAVELTDPAAQDPQKSWIVNGQRLKHYLGAYWVKLVTLKKCLLGGNPFGVARWQPTSLSKVLIKVQVWGCQEVSNQKGKSRKRQKKRKVRKERLKEENSSLQGKIEVIKEEEVKIHEDKSQKGPGEHQATGAKNCEKTIIARRPGDGRSYPGQGKLAPKHHMSPYSRLGELPVTLEPRDVGINRCRNRKITTGRRSKKGNDFEKLVLESRLRVGKVLAPHNACPKAASSSFLCRNKMGLNPYGRGCEWELACGDRRRRDDPADRPKVSPHSCSTTLEPKVSCEREIVEACPCQGCMPLPPPLTSIVGNCDLRHRRRGRNPFLFRCPSREGKATLPFCTAPHRRPPQWFPTLVLFFAQLLRLTPPHLRRVAAADEPATPSSLFSMRAQPFSVNTTPNLCLGFPLCSVAAIKPPPILQLEAKLRTTVDKAAEFIALAWEKGNEGMFCLRCCLIFFPWLLIRIMMENEDGEYGLSMMIENGAQNDVMIFDGDEDNVMIVVEVVCSCGWACSVWFSGGVRVCVDELSGWSFGSEGMSFSVVCDEGVSRRQNSVSEKWCSYGVKDALVDDSQWLMGMNGVWEMMGGSWDGVVCDGEYGCSDGLCVIVRPRRKMYEVNLLMCENGVCGESVSVRGDMKMVCMMIVEVDDGLRIGVCVREEAILLCPLSTPSTLPRQTAESPLGYDTWSYHFILLVRLGTLADLPQQQPQVTATSESRDLTSMNMPTFFGKLREHELELGRLKEGEEIEVKKSIALKATNRKALKIAQSEDESEAKLDNNELMSMMVRKFSRFMKNRNQLTDRAGNGKGKKATRSNVVQCYECGHEGLIKLECPDLKLKQRASRRFPQDKNKKQKNSSSDDDNDHEEESNVYFMVGSTKDEYDSDEEFKNEPIEVKYDMLLDAFKKSMLRPGDYNTRLEFQMECISGFLRNNYHLTSKGPNLNGYQHKKSQLFWRLSNDVVAEKNPRMD
ncbi:hypothetical protein V8G54_028516 [Vigna mungo]|uniref:Integrase catalytic domain-containing protein n=1 Tax=Vigna mungo TaxID=3915 RepID=A0AAQ3MSJ1_VIGMU